MKLDSLVWLALGRGYWWLFVFAIGQYAGESVMGRTESLTMVDRIHPQSISLQALLTPYFPN
jgi:hypothetical protein